MGLAQYTLGVTGCHRGVRRRRPVARRPVALRPSPAAGNGV